MIGLASDLKAKKIKEIYIIIIKNLIYFIKMKELCIIIISEKYIQLNLTNKEMNWESI